ncbi:MAG: hypothetical protein IJW13_02860 [Clostridia bacterium]|nr:hypothetical protein [Clostridia bacterium]
MNLLNANGNVEIVLIKLNKQEKTQLANYYLTEKTRIKIIKKCLSGVIVQVGVNQVAIDKEWAGSILVK